MKVKLKESRENSLIYIGSIHTRVAMKLRTLCARCIKSNINYDLDLEYVLELLENQNHKCKLSGIGLDFGVSSGVSVNGGEIVHPFRPSLDRVDPR
jgi:hypothetical protein